MFAVVFLYLALHRELYVTAKSQRSDSVTVKTTFGEVEGFTAAGISNGLPVNVFLGVRYGAAMTGSSRFGPPKDPVPWNGTLPAKTFSKICVQGKLLIYKDPKDTFWNSDLPQSEDCLTINIWAPKDKDKMAVLVWIHGGGFQTGTANADLYDGLTLASENEIVVVALNFRLSSLGYLYLKEPGAPGNVGLLDQTLALKWIKRNIRSFGGDPDKVTVAGESSGSASIGHHLVMKASSGLFKRAILQSGNSVNFWASTTKSSALNVTKDFAAKLGCRTESKNAGKVMRCLQSKPSTQIERVQKKLDYFVAFPPVVDGKVLPDSPVASLKSRKKLNAESLIVGSNSQDGTFFLQVFFPDKVWKEDTAFTKEDMKKVAEAMAGFKCDPVLDALVASYVDWSDPDNKEKILSAMNNMVSESYICADNAFADIVSAKANHKVYKYRFSHKPSTSRMPAWTGALHGDELPFVFGLPLDPARGFTLEEVQFSRTVMKYWANFAKTGDPSSVEDPVSWPSYSVATGRSEMELSPSPRVLKGDNVRECALWDKLLPSVSKDSCKV